jgi:hypothetical protein
VIVEYYKKTGNLLLMQSIEDYLLVDNNIVFQDDSALYHRVKL